MMKRVCGVFSTVSMAVLVLLCTIERVSAQSPAKVKSNQLFIEKEAKGILLLAHPTVTLTEATYDKMTKFKDGTYALTFKFTWQNFFNVPCYRYWDFKFTKEGTIFDIVDGDTDTTFEPFAILDGVFEKMKDKVRDQIRTGKVKEDDPFAKLILEAADMRRATVLILQLT